MTAMVGNYESMYWVQPLTDQKLNFFETWKTLAIPLNDFDYGYNGETFSCRKN